MLAPMQGLTNRGLRRLFARTVRPDVMFTEFVQVRPKHARRLLSDNDRAEVGAIDTDVPLVVQLIGPATDTLIHTAAHLDTMGVHHINLNLGCPFGRMVSRLSGGNILKDPTPVAELLNGLRSVVRGSLSVKTRCGYTDPRQILELVRVFEDAKIDFVILHARTVKQKYDGRADHAITAQLVRATSLPVIANGDIVDARGAERVLKQTGAAGLMLGRGALSDPWLFQRIRNLASPTPSPRERRAELAEHLLRLAEIYSNLFCGDTQVLNKLKATLAFIDEPRLNDWVKALRRSKRLETFFEVLERERIPQSNTGDTASRTPW